MISLNFDLPSPSSPNYKNDLDVKLREILRSMALEINRTSGSQWDSFHPIWGGNHVWVDASLNLRINSSVPTTDTDGTIVATFT